MCGPAVCGMERAELSWEQSRVVSHFPRLPSQPGFIGNTWAVGGAAATLQIQKSVLEADKSGWSFATLDWNVEARAAWPRMSWKLAFQESIKALSVTLRKALWFGCRNSHPIKNHRVWKLPSWPARPHPGHLRSQHSKGDWKVLQFHGQPGLYSKSVANLGYIMYFVLNVRGKRKINKNTKQQIQTKEL